MEILCNRETKHNRECTDFLKIQKHILKICIGEFWGKVILGHIKLTSFLCKFGFSGLSICRMNRMEALVNFQKLTALQELMAISI